MRLLTWIVALVTAAAGLLPAPALAQTGGEPTVVVRLKSFDGLLADGKYLAELTGQLDKAKEFEAAIQSLAGPKGLGGTGLDTKRPLAAYAFVGPNGVDSKAVVMLPITDEGAFLDTITNLTGHFGVTIKKEGDGVHVVTIPNAPVSAYIRFANQYAYVAAPDRSTVDAGNLLSATAKALTADDNELLGVTVNIDRIPDMMKQMALQKFELEMANARDQKKLNETAAQTKFKGQVLDTISQRVKSLFNEGETVRVKVAIDRSAGDVTANAALTGKPGSGLARDIAAAQGGRTVFGGVTADALRLALSLALPANLRDSFAAVVDEEAANALQNEKDPAKRDVAAKLIGALSPTIKAGELDVTAGVRGPNAAGHITVFAGIRVRDGKAIEKVLTDLTAQMPERERKAVTLNAATVDGIAVHRIDPGKDMDAEGRRLFGDRATGHVAFRPDAVFVVIGDETAGDMMKALIGSKPEAARAILDATASVARLSTLDKDKGPAAKKAADEVFGTDPRGRDLIQIGVEGGAAFTVRFSMKADVIKMGAKLEGK